jgi:photosystem II stability/assembly factor-like uncharacterized protein
MKKLAVCFSIVFVVTIVQAQQPFIQIIDTSTRTSIRGLSVVNDSVFWVSGNNGMVGKCTNGNTIQWNKIVGYEKRDFRDVEAFAHNHAIVMAVAEPAIILETKDGGNTWTKVFEDTTKGMFLDAMYFDIKGNGVVVGDPIQDTLFVATTKNFGASWQKNNKDNAYLIAAKEEAFFASSGTNVSFIKINNKWQTVMVTGGKESNVIVSNKYKVKLPLAHGKESTGANSIACFGNKAIVVGGDFANDTSSTNNSCLIHFNKKNEATFSKSVNGIYGYKSCAAFIDENTIIACGTSGVDISNDGGNNFKTISKLSFHVVQKAKNGKAVYLAGSRGKVAKFLL